MESPKPARAVRAVPAETKRVEPSQKKHCFVISPIGPDDSDVRKRADQVLRHIIKKALADTYAVERADDIGKPGLITLQIIERLMKAPMVVADLTARSEGENEFVSLALGIQSALSNLNSELRQVGAQVSYLADAALNERASSGLFGTLPPVTGFRALAQPFQTMGSLRDLAGPRFPSSKRRRSPGPLEPTPDAGPVEPPPVATGTPLAQPVTPPKDEK